MFGLIMPNYTSFNDPLTFKCLFTPLVRSHLEYATIIWDSNNICISNQIEAIQNKFLRFISFKFNIGRPSHSGYNIILNFLNFDSLSNRRNKFSMSFLKKTIE